MTINERISQRLKQMGKRQFDLAIAINVPVSTLNGWLRLGRDVPAHLIIPIADFLGMPVNELAWLGGPEAAEGIAQRHPLQQRPKAQSRGSRDRPLRGARR